MYVFLKEKMKYPAVCTEDSKHWILVACNKELVDSFCKEKGFTPNYEEKYFVVHSSPEDTLFSFACASLPRRLNPIGGENDMPADNFYAMHQYFYRNSKRQLIVKGVYVGNGENCPFTEADTTVPGFICLKDIKLRG